MSIIEKYSRYLKLFSDFYDCSISAVDFDRNFTEHWDSDRDEEWAKRKEWEHSFNFNTDKWHLDLSQGRISEEECNERWDKLRKEWNKFKSDNWNVSEQRYDELFHEFYVGEFSAAKYVDAVGKLSGMTDGERALICSLVLSCILDRTYTTCDCFWSDTSDEKVCPPIVLNEKLFREEIFELFAEIQRWYDMAKVVLFPTDAPTESQ